MADNNAIENERAEMLPVSTHMKDRGCLPYLVPVLSFWGRVNLLDSAMCRINDHTRPPISLCSDTLPSHKTCRQPSNDCVSFPTTLILGKRHLGWRTSMF